MEIISCKECGKLFNFIRGQRICPACSRKLEDKFMEVKKYVREHPDVDVKELSEEMDVSVRQINRWVREERLVFSDDSPVGLLARAVAQQLRPDVSVINVKQS